LNQIKEENPFFYMHNLGVNYATCVNFSHSSEKFIICGLSAEKTIEIFEFIENEPSKKYFSSIKKFPSNLHKEEVKNAYYLNNSCLITFGGGTDTTIKVWNFKNELLSTIDTKQVKHFDSFLSQSGKFLMAGTWSPDVKIFELKLEKDQTFKSIAKVMNLGEHKSGVYYISCSVQENRVVTISSDNFLRIWNINVEYEKKGDPKCLFSLNMKSNEYFSGEVQIKSADVYFDETNEKKQFLAVSHNNNIVIISLNTMKIIEKIERAHSDNDIIKSLRFKEIGNGLGLLSCGTDDCRINVFKVKI
jgi:WD40 repeat protein